MGNGMGSQRPRRHMGNPIGQTKAEATHGKPKWAHKGTGDTWETMGNPKGLTNAGATHGKPKWAEQRQGRHMGNPNGLTKKEATVNKGTGDTWETQLD
jgi:hypothetical protein